MDGSYNVMSHVNVREDNDRYEAEQAQYQTNHDNLQWQAFGEEGCKATSNHLRQDGSGLHLKGRDGMEMQVVPWYN